ncbi:formate dehydrogenase accessory protein FdhE [Paraburkholderia lacunae]|uniref:Protein FdhE homolog n=1 Tax=Paraburkholderia lacunae TaxID=2211104 RepID=A0A370NEM3_9BURK|nr:formate dehydrogenase accessory protein FdhE [Paraburkholderia lacunae]RDK04033.1 formate dehydrogenase accessory protein FdhE [Paraburkholderia lacunae]
MIQRILQPGEIEALDQTAIPRIRLPDRATVFAERAARLRKLADHNPIAGYLRLMATVVDAQHQILATFSARPLAPNSLKLAQAHSMPLASALASERDPAWRGVLRRVLDGVDAAGPVTPALGKLLDGLRAMSDAELAAAADAVLALSFTEVDPATAPFLMAALQVVWTDIATRLDTRDIPYLDTPGLCPVCGSPPVASIVRIGGQYQGYRFLQCSLCACEWHMVRVKCSHCDSTKGIAYHGIVGGDALKAESCDECHTYRKIGYQEKDYAFEPLADDLASLTLDLLMSEAGFQRASPNPLLWPQSSDA